MLLTTNITRMKFNIFILFNIINYTFIKYRYYTIVFLINNITYRKLIANIFN